MLLRPLPLWERATQRLNEEEWVRVFLPQPLPIDDALPALTTALSLCAQWLLNRKYLENWYYWIIVDIFYVPMYAYKNLYLTALLYIVFLVMATMGLLEWRRRFGAQKTVTGMALELA